MFSKIAAYLRERSNRRALGDIERHLSHILHVNDDVLSDSVKREAKSLIEETRAQDPAKIQQAREFIGKAPLRAAKIFPRTNFPVLREYADIIAVAFSVAFGIRALYFQPFKIPTSSMQPTLFGIHYISAEAGRIPELPPPLGYAFFSTQRALLEVEREGSLDLGDMMTYRRFFFLDRTRLRIGGISYDLPGDRDQVFRYCFKVRDFPDLNELTTKVFKAGKKLCDGWLSLGDHLFVDRYTFHFRDPRRGDVTVFVTEGLPCRARGYFYIKRLIGMPGDTLKIVEGEVQVREKGSDRFVPITSFGIERLNKIYSWKGGYHGHLPISSLAFGREVEVPRDCYFMMGDNSANSSDSREWGFVPRRNIIGKALFVWWPFSRRWGFVDTKPPLDVETTEGLPEMELQ